MPEATAAFKQQLREAFDAMHVGQAFSFRRTFGDGDLSLFCGVTGDFNPYHLDDMFARETWYGKRIIPGLLAGSMMTHIGGLLGFLATEMAFHYLAPVFVGDTLTCTMTVTSKDEVKRRVSGDVLYVNQDGIEVLRAEFSGFPSQIRLAR